jgi:hypothetical protein
MPAPPLVPGQGTILVCSVPYFKALGKKAKIILSWIEPFIVLEGPDNNNNFKIKFGPMITSIYPWIVRSQVKPYLFPNKSMYSSKCFARLRLIEVKVEVWVMEKSVNDRKKN